MGRAIYPFAVFGLAYFVAAAIPIAFSRLDGGLAFVWVASGLLTARLRTSAPEYRRNWLIAAGIASFCATAGWGLGWIAAFPMMLINLAEALIAERILLAIERNTRKDNIPLIGWAFIGASVLAPAATMLPAALVAALITDTWLLSNAMNWFVGHSLSNLTMGPVIALCMRGLLWPWLRGMLTGCDHGSLGAVLLVISATTLAFAQDDYPLLFIPTLTLVALTYRASRQGAAFGVFLVSVIGGLLTQAGHGPVQLSAGNTAEKLQFFQLYLGVTTLTVLPVASAIAGRVHVQEVLRKSEERYRALADHTTDIVISLDLQGRLTFVSPSIRYYGDHSDQDVIGRSALELIDPAFHEAVREAHARMIESPGAPVTFEYIGKTGSAETRWFETNGRCTLDQFGQPNGVIGTIRETTARKMQEDALSLAASTDTLTGLPNRRAFIAAATAAAASGEPGSIAMLDLDHFKRINDKHGHAGGDHVLREFARRGRLMLREQDLLARMGGEEFALLLPGALPEDAEAICERLLGVLSAEPVVYDGQPIGVTASGGVSALTGDVEQALRRADEALYVAKRSGRARMALAA